MSMPLLSFSIFFLFLPFERVGCSARFVMKIEKVAERQTFCDLSAAHRFSMEMMMMCRMLQSHVQSIEETLRDLHCHQCGAFVQVQLPNFAEISSTMEEFHHSGGPDSGAHYFPHTDDE